MCVCVCLWGTQVRSCPSEHTLIFNYFSSVILNAADRINIAQANVRITNVGITKATLSLFTQNNFKTSESIRFFGSEVTQKNYAVGRMNSSTEVLGQRWKMWGLFDQAKMWALMAAKIQRPKRLCSVTQEEAQCLWTPGLLTVPEKCFLIDSLASLLLKNLKFFIIIHLDELANNQIFPRYVCLVFRPSQELLINAPDA